MSLTPKPRENADLYITQAGPLEFIFAKQKKSSFVILSTPKKQGLRRQRGQSTQLGSQYSVIWAVKWLLKCSGAIITPEERGKCAVRSITREKVKAMSDTTFHIGMQILHNQNLCLLIGRKGYGIKHLASWTAQHVLKWHSKLKKLCSSPVLHRTILIQLCFLFNFRIFQVRLNWNSPSYSF